MAHNFSFWPIGVERTLFITLEDFSQHFPGEGHNVEWKAGSGRKPIQEAVVAFSNADGGLIMLGVQEDGDVIGKSLDAGLEKDLWEVINEIESPGQVQIGEITVGEVPITIISVEKRRQGVAQTSDGRPLIRLGKQNLPLKGEQLRHLMNRRALISFDSSPSPWSIDHVDPALAAELCEALKISYPMDEADFADILEQRELAIRQGASATLTFAGALYLVSQAPQAIGKCHIEIFRFQHDAKEHEWRLIVSGTPAQQVRKATAWIEEQLGFDLVIVGPHRHELPRLPNRAIRESLANAVAHRDYQLSGSAIKVRVTPVEVQIISPGGFVDPVTKDNLLRAQSARNRRIITMLRHFGLAEDAGRGIRVILDEMAADLRAEPAFEEDVTGHVTVRLPIESPVAPEERAWVREQETQGQLKPTDRRVLIEAARGVELTNALVRSLLNVDSHRARRSLHRLRDAGFLEQDGVTRGARYRLAGTIAPPIEVPLTKKEMKTLLLQMARERPLTNRLLRAHLGLSRGQIRNLLRELIEEDLLEMRGAKRGSYYVLSDPTED